MFSSRRFLIFVVGFVFGMLILSCDRKEVVLAERAELRSSGADEINSDATEVFQSAFWRRPGGADEILNAERRHWLDDGEVSVWQWFLEVRPSKELENYLRERNAFALSEIEPDPVLRDAPDWFRYPVQGAMAMGDRGGEMTLVFCSDGRLFATGKGAGFREAVGSSGSSWVGD